MGGWCHLKLSADEFVCFQTPDPSPRILRGWGTLLPSPMGTGVLGLCIGGIGCHMSKDISGGGKGQSVSMQRGEEVGP